MGEGVEPGTKTIQKVQPKVYRTSVSDRGSGGFKLGKRGTVLFKVRDNGTFQRDAITVKNFAASL